MKDCIAVHFYATTSRQGNNVKESKHMLRQFRNPGQEITIKRRTSNNDKDDYIRLKICDIDLHTGRVEVGVTASPAWEIYRAESPRSGIDESDK
jgi:hypothetical protein